MNPQISYAGSILYKPRTSLDEGKIRLLRQKMKDAGIVWEPENPSIVIDWYISEQDSNRTPIKQSYIVLFRDGGDTERPAVIFYRKDIDRQINSTKEFFHIPENQQQFAGVWKWWEDLTGQQLRMLNEYAGQIINKPVVWNPL